MKKIKTLLYLILTIGIVISTLQISFAADSPTKLKQVFTPDRPAIQFNGEGLSYPSFNNFSGNPNIGNNLYNQDGTIASAKDERVFMHVKHQCRDGGTTCCAQGSTEAICKYYDTIGMTGSTIPGSKNLQAGDILRFQIYFHNNGSDPYDDNAQKNSANAREVQIGVDFTNIGKLVNDPEPNIIRPTGFIYSKSNIYKIGNESLISAKATDDTQAFYLPNLTDVKLEVVKDSAYLEMNTDGNNNTIEFGKYIKTPTEINFDTFIDSPTVTVAPKYIASKAWLQFDELPGCFRYSGLAYFDAKVVATELQTPTYCTSLTLTKQTQQTCNPNTKFIAFTAKVNFTDEQNKPTEQYIVFDSTDKKAKLTLLPPNQGTITEFPSKPQKVIVQSIAGMYDGIGTIKATYTDAQGKPIEGLVAEAGTGNIYPGFCTGSIPTCTDDCVDICVEHPVDIPAGSLSEFSAEATGYYGNTWSGQIQYYAEKGKGKFYKGTKEKVIAQIKKDFPGANPYDNPNMMLGCDNVINIVITPQNILNLINNTFDTQSPSEEVKETNETLTLPQYNFIKQTKSIQEQTYEVPENFQMEKVPPSGDPNPVDAKKFMNNVLMALDLSPVQPKSQDINLKPAYNVSTDVGQDLKTIDLPKGTINLTPINDEPLNPLAYESAVTAKNKETVWFYAAKEGGDSIVVSATDTLNPDCSQKFNTSPPSLCQSMKVSVYDKKSAVNKGDLPCINEGQMVEFQIDEVTTTNGKKLDLSKDKVSTLWTTTDSLGKFAKNGQKTLNTIDQSITYTGKGQVQCEVTSINGITDANSLCTYSKETCSKVVEKCGQLDLKFNEIVKPVASNKITTVDKTKEAKGAEMTLAIASDKNADYPSSVIWEDTTGGELTFKNPQHVQKLPDSFMTKVVGGVETVVTIKNYSAKYPEAGMPTLKKAKHGGTLTAKVQGEELICAATLSVIAVGEMVENVCQVLNTQVQRMGASEWETNPVTIFSTNTYYIQNTVAYSPEIDEGLKLVDYKTDNKGYFTKIVKIGEQPGTEKLPQWLLDTLGDLPLLAGKNIEWAGVKELKGVLAGQSVMFIPSKDLPAGTYANAITITASGSTEPGCTKSIALVVQASEKACQSIIFNADKWQPTTNGDKIKLSLALGDLGNYAGSFSFSISDSSKPYLSIHQASQTGTQTLTVSKDQAFGAGVYLLNPDMEKNWSVSVKADEAGTTKCTGTKWFTYTPTGGGDSNGGSNGSSGGNGETKETSPDITKKVGKGGIGEIKDKDWEDTINVSGKPAGKPNPNQFVTYKIEYENGKHNGLESVLIKDEDLIEGKIKSKGNLDGTLNFKDMKIKIGSDKDFKEICEYDEDGELTSDNDICVTNKDADTKWTNLEKSFKNGDGLVFNNLKSGTEITIFYQMINQTAISEAVCRELIAKNGCGEEFDNKVSFEAHSKNELEGSKKTGSDSAKVIAVCPYILTRASGDVFFETPLETGMDVAYCSPQKNVQAPIITPIEPPEIIAKSGGTTRSATLTLPSHDICKYSNVKDGDNPSDYQNPFKNFSSTICEMKAEVAEDWMKTNVVSQIGTNAEKISLWSVKQTTTTLENAASLQMATTGIFKWEGQPLTIKGQSAYRTDKVNEYTIAKSLAQSVPAAQTYIIMNADLNIDSNIVYSSNISTSSDLKSYPSAAFIVINGNINIASDVTQLDGTYIAIDTDDTDRKTTGQVISRDGESYSQLTINGSLIGDVTDLFMNRKYVGNIAADEGSVTIKYNENFLLNPPPGLNQLMDIKQLEVAY